MKELEGLSWNCKWVTHLGCLKGCLDYLGVEVSDAWLFGATGHGFVLNIHEQLCPSGPTAWRAEPIHRLGKSVGYLPEMVLGFKQQEDFAAKQELAWEMIRAAIDEGLPCFGWELVVPEYYVITGYDDVGYCFKGPGCDEGKGPKPWRSVGDTGIGVLEMYVIRPASPADDSTIVKRALQFASEYGRDPSAWTFEGYTGGLAGYDTWVSALENGRADGFGTAYNAVVWSECRSLAAAFLCEAKERLSPYLADLLERARASYGVVAENMQTVAEAFPFIHGPGGGEDAERQAEAEMQTNMRDSERCARSIEALRAAQEAEISGLKVLEGIVAELGRRESRADGATR